jgi:hypothetical protein
MIDPVEVDDVQFEFPPASPLDMSDPMYVFNILILTGVIS